MRDAVLAWPLSNKELRDENNNPSGISENHTAEFQTPHRP
jgi:hypothetical protein